VEQKNTLIKKRIFISPLDWGLGHASRLVPLIQHYQNKGHQILIGAEGKTAAFLIDIFPDIPQIHFPGYHIRYARRNTEWKLLMQIPQLIKAIIREHFLLKKIVKKYDIEIVFSDNRFGLWHLHTKNYILSHQLQILYPDSWKLSGKIVNFMNRYFLNSFDQCLVPDTKNHQFSARLSQNNKIKNPYFTGPLSRFKAIKLEPVEKKSEDLVFVLSGPEPQRSLFEELIIKQLEKNQLKAIIITGNPEENYPITVKKNITRVAHLPILSFAQTLQGAKVVFSRSGYSSLMDYAALHLKQVVLIPTPKQTEQEYLAKLFDQNQFCFHQTQDHFSIHEAVERVKNYRGFQREDFSDFKNYFPPL
jgi:UDP-N-acetylglucosamine:LPS N-acetylglucosamine transferase